MNLAWHVPNGKTKVVRGPLFITTKMYGFCGMNIKCTYWIKYLDT